MAITKTHPIKSTVNNAIEYILNPDKTDGKILVSSFACSLETADIEFDFTRKKSPSFRGNVLARHLIQSFSPGETTPEIAHEIGVKLADNILDGKYEYVISTHIDKGHIHNHIIFNSVSFVDYKKYRSNKVSYRNIRRISDELCSEYGLSVVKENENHREYKPKFNLTFGKKALLKLHMDMSILNSDNYDSFISSMEKHGYNIKFKNDSIYFCSDSMKRFMDSKFIGENYTINNIKNRITNKSILHEKLGLIIEIQKSIYSVPKGNQYYQLRAKIHNLKKLADTLNYITEKGYTTLEKFNYEYDVCQICFDNTLNSIKQNEERLKQLSILIKQIDTYTRLKPKYSKVNATSMIKLTPEYILYKNTYDNLKANSFPAIVDLRKEYKEICERNKILYDIYSQNKSKIEQFDIIKSNIDSLLNFPDLINSEHHKELEHLQER